MTNTDIIFIINSFNRLSLLKECLNILTTWLPQSILYKRCGVVIYDAGSTDGSIEWLKSNSLQLGIPLEIITPEPSDDTSFAAGLNAGAAHAEKIFPNLQYLLFYETDNQFLEAMPILQALSKLEEEKNLSACGFTVRLHNGKPAGVGMPFPTLINFLLGKNLVHKFQLEKIRYCWEKSTTGVEFSKVDSVFTSPLLVRIEAWKKSGGLDSQVFPFSDCDVDWARRLQSLGWRMGVIHTTAVIHDNTGALSSWSQTRSMQFHRARLNYFRRYRPISIFLIWPVLLSVRHIFELAMVKLLEKEPTRRNQLTNQLLNLLKSCPKKYE